MLSGRRVLLGVTGSIAAYKAVSLLRRLTAMGAEVTVVMTEAAMRFVGPLTFQTLSGRPVHHDLFEPREDILHLTLAETADVFLIAPATANTIAKLAAGAADDLLSALALSARGPVVLAPAMDAVMWEHRLVQRNLAATLAEFEEARRQAEKLAKETQSLQELIARMDEKIRPAARAVEEVEMEPSLLRAALTDPGRIRPAISFAAAKGLLPLPVAGATVSRFGDPDGFGSTSRGVAIATRRSAQVTSPSDGWVVFSGTFRSYGQLLIINVGGGYHVLLAGLERISVDLGQFVLAGEPVGVMGGGVTPGYSFTASGPLDRPVLYVEFRKDGNSIDPTPWWASAEEKVRG